MNELKTIQELIEHLKEKGISFDNDNQMNQLRNYGYYHGYKGYRFFKDSSRMLPISSYENIIRTIRYDSELKKLFYDKIMFIETAIKNISLIIIMKEIESCELNDLYEKGIESFRNCPEDFTDKQKTKAQKNLLTLQSMIHSNISNAYSKSNPKITHFYNSLNYKSIPLWAVFEIMTMGDFGFLLSILVYDLRDKISKEIGINLSVDTQRELLSKYVYMLKDLRNAIAHNDVIYDVRFRKNDPSDTMMCCLKSDLKLPYVNFKDIIDYVALIVYFLDLLNYESIEIQNFIGNFEKITDEYIQDMPQKIIKITVNSNWKTRINCLKNFLKNLA